MEPTSDDFIAKLKTLPPEVDMATSSYKFLASLYQIAGNYALDDKQAEALIDATLLRAVDIIRKEDLAEKIGKIGIVPEKVEQILLEVETNIIGKLLSFAHGDISTEEFYKIYNEFKAKEPEAAGLAFLDERLGESFQQNILPPPIETATTQGLASQAVPLQPSYNETPESVKLAPNSEEKPHGEPAQTQMPTPPKQYPGGEDPYREPVE